MSDLAPEPDNALACNAGAFRHARSHLAVIAGVLSAAGVAVALAEPDRLPDCPGAKSAAVATRQAVNVPVGPLDER